MDLKDMDFNQLTDYLTGHSLIMLGRGESLRSITFETMRITLQWRAERAEV